jgi:hypothetical protein
MLVHKPSRRFWLDFYPLLWEENGVVIIFEIPGEGVTG